MTPGNAVATLSEEIRAWREPETAPTAAELADQVYAWSLERGIGGRSERDIAPLLRRYGQAGDMVICLGAGNSTEWAHSLPQWLAGEPLRAGGAA